jgi:hypothetical protein
MRMSAFESASGDKADMTLCGNPLLRSLLGVKRTSLFAAQMTAFDPSGHYHSTLLLYGNLLSYNHKWRRLYLGVVRAPTRFHKSYC